MTISSSANAAKALLRKFKRSTGSYQSPSFGRGYEIALRHAVNCGIEADVVYDVGAAVGTPWLYQAFPRANFVLFEPLPTHVDTLRMNYPGQDFEIHQTAIGAQTGVAKLHVPSSPTALKTWSSLHRPTPNFAKFAEARGITPLDTEDIEVPISPLDDFVREGSNIIKIDAEGSELDVLKGGDSLLKSCELVIIELSVFPRFEGEGSFANIICYLDQCGFELFDIPLIFYPIPDRDPTLIDALFVPSSRRRAGKWIDQRGG